MSQFAARVFYEFCYWVLALIFSIAFGLRVRGKTNVPKSGPLLIVANHQSFIDPPVIGVAVRRHISYLARKTLFSKRWFGNILRALNSVPIDQDGVGKDGIREILNKLREGHAVLVFPEGSRTFDGKLQEFKPGIALLFKRANVPILPVGVAGAYESWPRSKKWPTFSWFFDRGSRTRIAVSIGQVRQPKTLVDASREEILKTLFRDIEAEWKSAEHLRLR